MTPDEGTAADAGGQGNAESSSFFEPYLQAVPEEHRDTVGGYLKDAEKGVNTQLREAADLRKQFGDYSDVDLSGITPEQLTGVLDFVRQVGESPEAYQEWLRSEATEAGLLVAAQQQQGGEFQDPELESYIQSRIDQALNPVQQKLSQFEQTTQAQQQERAQAAMEQQIESAFKGLEAEHGALSDEQKEAILALGEQVESDDFVAQGFAKLRALEGGAQAGLARDKASQPASTLHSGGQAEGEKPKTFADVRAAALEMIEQAT